MLWCGLMTSTSVVNTSAVLLFTIQQHAGNLSILLFGMTCKFRRNFDIFWLPIFSDIILNAFIDADRIYLSTRGSKCKRSESQVDKHLSNTQIRSICIWLLPTSDFGLKLRWTLFSFFTHSLRTQWKRSLVTDDRRWMTSSSWLTCSFQCYSHTGRYVVELGRRSAKLTTEE